MKQGALKGFTIIEVILFFAITGLIMSVMLIGISNGLNQERYRDASTSLVGYFQEQYSNVANVSNSRASTDMCPGSLLTTDRGTSDCFIVGRIITSTASGAVIESRRVFATVEVTPEEASAASMSDLQILQNSVLRPDTAADSYTMEWGTKLINPSSSPAGDRTFTLMIVRVPTNGAIHTYLMNIANRTPQQMVTVAPPAQPTGEFVACLEPAGLIKPTQSYTGIQIVADSANSSGVKFVSAGDC
ncbi:hypothetical protein EOL96_03120 [Candidatus Saccharibacteria bacterium]|nr:hypothetical protein [Candidatus Saccharibacteria bacterium]